MGTFKCNTCNTRGTQLSRLEAWHTMLGSYQNYSAEEKEKFWVDVGEASNLESIKKVVEERLTTKSIQRKKSSSSGAYYPRSWYDAHGFDGELIERTCTGKRPHDILGTVYCVEIEVKADENEHAKQQTEDLKKRKQ